jgi:protein phosphatase
MRLVYYGITDRGRKRAKNEDRFRINAFGDLFLVADGMGGHLAGEIASKIAVDTVEDFISLASGDEEITWPFEVDSSLPEEANQLKVAIQLANRKIFNLTKEKTDLEGMGTTIVAALIKNGSAYIAHVGDSRAYLLRGETIRALTSDHSWVNMQVSLGMMSPEDARDHPLKNIITRALGTRSEVEVDIRIEEFRHGDYLVLCSDGLSSLVSEEQIRQTVVQEQERVEQAAIRLVEMANEAGGEDNITAVIVHCLEDESDDQESDEEITEVIHKPNGFPKPPRRIPKPYRGDEH